MAQEIVSRHKHNMLSLLYATCLKLLVFFILLSFGVLRAVLVVTVVSGQPVEIEPIGHTETSLGNYESAPRNAPEERRPYVKA